MGVARPRTITDERLLTATAAVIERVGPGFTLAQVAGEAGVAVGSVAQRFGSKAGLLRALSEAGSVQAVERMRSAADAAESAESAVAAALLAVFAQLDAAGDSAAGNSRVVNHLAQLGTDLADAELRGLLGLHYAALREELSRLLRAAARDGWSGPDPDVAARVLLAAVNGAALDWSLRSGDTAAGRAVLSEWLAETIDVIMKGWLP